MIPSKSQATESWYLSGPLPNNANTTQPLNSANRAEAGATASHAGAAKLSETTLDVPPVVDWGKCRVNQISPSNNQPLPEWLQQNAAVVTIDASKVPAPYTPSGTVGKKFDGGKPPMVQGMLYYFGKALEGVALVSAYGRAKYDAVFADKNWAKVDNAKGRYADALLRHLTAYSRGEAIDEESGKPHIDMVAWNALALSELEKV